MSDKKPPRIGLRVLAGFCPPGLYEMIEGDLLEQFESDVKELGEKTARRRFMWSVFKFFRPGIIFRNKFSFELNQLDMFLSHFKFAVRIFLKDKMFSTLNILGLALGIAVSILLLLILQNDLTYDQYHVNYKRIYRVGCHQQQTGLDFRWARSAMDLGVILKEELPEIRAVVRMDGWGRRLVKYEYHGDKKAFYEERIFDTDSTYFQVFTHSFISGNPETCMRNAHAAVVTETTAKKYFGEEDPMGKSLVIGDDSWTVTGVIQDLPENPHIKFDFLLANRQWIMKEKIESENFWNPGVYLYILVPDGYKPQDFYAKFPVLYNKYFKSFGVEVGGKYTPILEPLADIHFHSDLDQDEPHGNISYVYGFTLTGIFIILLACINYMNLSTAKSVGRAIEIAVKKLVGSHRHVLVLSFLSESIFLSLISLILAIILVLIALNLTSFNQLIGKNLTIKVLQNPHITAAATANSVLGTNVGGVQNFWAESDTGMKQTGFTTLYVGEDYIKTMGMKIIQGKDFQPGAVPKEETSYILNETAAKLMGWENSAIGKRMKFFHGEIPGHVIGVVKDFNFKSLHNAVE